MDSGGEFKGLKTTVCGHFWAVLGGYKRHKPIKNRSSLFYHLFRALPSRSCNCVAQLAAREKHRYASKVPSDCGFLELAFKPALILVQRSSVPSI